MTMRKINFSITILCLFFSLDAAEQKTEPAPAEREALRKERIARVGGLLPRPGTPSGRVAFVNNQSAVSINELKATQERNSTKIRGIGYWTNGVPVSIASATVVRKMLNANFAIFIVEDATLPMSLVALEERWAFVNITALRGEGVGSDLVCHRAKNEFARIYGILCGGAASQFKSRLMNFVDSPADLNGCTDELPVDTTAKMVQYVEARGCKPLQLAPYSRACEEGWAPAPTNEVQKAIWDKVHAMPTEPIKIKPEAKKVSE